MRGGSARNVAMNGKQRSTAEIKVEAASFVETLARKNSPKLFMNMRI